MFLTAISAMLLSPPAARFDMSYIESHAQAHTCKYSVTGSHFRIESKESLTWAAGRISSSAERVAKSVHDLRHQHGPGSSTYRIPLGFLLPELTLRTSHRILLLSLCGPSHVRVRRVGTSPGGLL